MKFISSESNELVKKLKRLAHSARNCKKEGQTVAEGIHLARELSKHSELIRAVVLCAGALKNAEIAEVVSELDVAEKSFYEFPVGLYQKVCPVENSTGILCLIDIPEVPPFPENEDWVFLDDVQDPGNVGTIIRSSLAADVANIAFSSGTAYPWSPKVLRAGMGIHFHARIFPNIKVDELKTETSNQCLVADARGGSSLFETAWDDEKRKTIWVFGNEGQGVSQSSLDEADKVLLIPLNSAVESLNVAMAATICLFEQKRRRLAARSVK